MDSGSMSGKQRVRLLKLEGWRVAGPPSCLADEDGNITGGRRLYYKERSPNSLRVINVDIMMDGEVKIGEEENIEFASLGDQQLTDHNHNGTAASPMVHNEQIPPPPPEWIPVYGNAFLVHGSLEDLAKGTAAVSMIPNDSVSFSGGIPHLRRAPDDMAIPHPLGRAYVHGAPDDMANGINRLQI